MARRHFALLLLWLVAPAGARATPNDALFLYWGEPDPSGADEALFAIAKRRGASVLREVPGRLADEPGAAPLMRGISAYQALRFADAVAALDELEHNAVSAGGGTLSQGDLVDLYAYRAAARLALGEEARAWDDLLALATIAPTRPLDPARFAPRLLEAARRAQQSLPAPIEWTIVAEPADAAIFLDGALVGRGQYAAPVVPGRHFVRASRTGFRSEGRLVDALAPSGSVRIALTPQRAPTIAELQQRASLSGASEVVAAYIAMREGSALLVLDRLDVRGSKRIAHAELTEDAQLTSVKLAASVDSLFATVPPVAAPAPRPWYRQALVWGFVGVAAAVVATIALTVALASSSNGASIRLDLANAR